MENLVWAYIGDDGRWGNFGRPFFGWSFFDQIFVGKRIAQKDQSGDHCGRTLRRRGRHGKLASFVLKVPLDNFARQAGEIHLFHSKDDPCVPFAQLEKYKKALPAAQAHIFADRGHSAKKPSRKSLS